MSIIPNSRTTHTKRLPPEERRKEILQHAVRFFSEHGFEANTRDLAQQLGFTQPLLYRYFASKDDLIQSVVTHMFERQANFDWKELLTDKALPVQLRIERFLVVYAQQIYDREWIRLYMFAGLAGGEVNRRYIDSVTHPLLTLIAGEIRAEIDPERTGPISIEEMDLLWLFHGGFYYQSIRRSIYGHMMDDDEIHMVAKNAAFAMVAGMSNILGEAKAGHV
jgi:AcrR family transcriptional regulator